MDNKPFRKNNIKGFQKQSYLKSYYENEYKEAHLQSDLRRKNRLYFCFEKGIKDKRILNVGSGPGVDIEFLVNENEVHAIDIVEETLQIAASKGFIPHNIDLNMGYLPFKKDYFDVIIATDILEHLFQPKKLLCEIHRVLKKDGFAIVSVPNHFYWNMRIRILTGKGIVLPFHNSNEWDYFHIRFFTLRSFKKLLNEIGFVIIEEFYDKFINIPKGLPHFIDRWLARKFPTLFSMHFMVKVTKR